MTLLETLITLSLVAILTALSVFGYQHLIIRTQVEADAQLIQAALAYARDAAARSQPSSVQCHQTACEVISALGEKIFNLSGGNTISTHLFPASAGATFVFKHDGLTAFHNGSIDVRAESGHEKRVVVSQGGRISIR